MVILNRPLIMFQIVKSHCTDCAFGWMAFEIGINCTSSSGCTDLKLFMPDGPRLENKLSTHSKRAGSNHLD